MKKNNKNYENVYPAGDPFLAYLKANSIKIDLEKLKEYEKLSCYEKGHYDAHAAPWMRCG